MQVMSETVQPDCLAQGLANAARANERRPLTAGGANAPDPILRISLGPITGRRRREHRFGHKNDKKKTVFPKIAAPFQWLGKELLDHCDKSLRSCFVSHARGWHARQKYRFQNGHSWRTISVAP